MIFVVVFSALAVALAGVSGTNVQVAANHHRVNMALHAAQSGLECAKYIVSTASFGETNLNYVTVAQADQVCANLCQHAQNLKLDGQTRPARYVDNPLVKVGQFAPDFELPRLTFRTDTTGKPIGVINEKDTIRLSAFRGKKPVCLIMSSYT